MIGNNRIYLRALEPDDLDILFRWENSPELWDVGNIISPISRQLLKDYISNYNADIFIQKELRLMIIDRTSDEPVGAIDITDFDTVNRRAEIGILIDKEWRNKGYGLDALILTSDYCFNRLGMHQLWSLIADNNVASKKLFETAGFMPCCTLFDWLRNGTEYINAIVFQLFHK